MLTLALVVLLAVTTSLPIAVIGLVVLGGPAGVGSALLFAHLKHSGASPADVVNTRAIMSFSWAAGPPLAAFIIGAFGERAILVVIAAVAVLMIAATAAMLAQRSAAGVEQAEPGEAAVADRPVPRAVVALIVAAFVALQATNYTVVAIMGVFVTQTLGLDVVWAGIALGVAAGLEIPFLLLSRRLSRRYSNLTLVAAGSLVGVVFYVGMAAVSGTVALIGLQILNACFFAAVAGVGLALFQEVIARPGMAFFWPLHERAPRRCDRRGTADRLGFADGSRISRDLRRLRGAHRRGAGSDRDRRAGELAGHPQLDDRLTQGGLGQDLDVPVRPVHADPLPIPDQPGGVLHPHDGRQAVLPCDHRAVGHQAAHLRHQARRSRRTGGTSWGP